MPDKNNIKISDGFYSDILLAAGDCILNAIACGYPNFLFFYFFITEKAFTASAFAVTDIRYSPFLAETATFGFSVRLK